MTKMYMTELLIGVLIGITGVIGIFYQDPFCIGVSLISAVSGIVGLCAWAWINASDKKKD